MSLQNICFALVYSKLLWVARVIGLYCHVHMTDGGCSVRGCTDAASVHEWHG